MSAAINGITVAPDKIAVPRIVEDEMIPQAALHRASGRFFFAWKAIKDQKAKQPYANATKDGSPFGLGGLWENWNDPTSGEWVRMVAIFTTDANELVAAIHDCMPLILAPDWATSPIRATHTRQETLDPKRTVRPGQGRCGLQVSRFSEIIQL